MVFGCEEENDESTANGKQGSTAGKEGNETSNIVKRATETKARLKYKWNSVKSKKRKKEMKMINVSAMVSKAQEHIMRDPGNQESKQNTKKRDITTGKVTKLKSKKTKTKKEKEDYCKK